MNHYTKEPVTEREWVFRKELFRELAHSVTNFELQFAGIKELMAQHDHLTKLANDKAQETLNERLNKMNEFRDQQKDIIAGFATLGAVENLSKRIEQNVTTSTDRFERNTQAVSERLVALKTAIDDKMDIVLKHSDDKIEMVKKNLDDRREMLYGLIQESIKSVQEKIDSNLKVELARFEASDKQMYSLINANAEVSNAGIQSLNSSRDKQEGSLKVIIWVLGVVATIVISLVIGFLNKHA